MKILQINRFNVCPETGITDFEFTWDLGYGQKKDGGAFNDKADAEKYLYKFKKDYVLILFEKYYNHARTLFEIDSKEFYKTPEKTSDLDRIRKYNTYLQDKGLSYICSMIVKLRPELEHILPSKTSTSYNTSWDMLITMQAFCRAECNENPVKTQLSIA